MTIRSKQVCLPAVLDYSLQPDGVGTSGEEVIAVSALAHAFGDAPVPGYLSGAGWAVRG
jgi:hypothetical protein